MFEDVLSWAKFRALPAGSRVYWRQKEGEARYEGQILGFEVIGGYDFISVCITKARRSVERGSTRKINQRYFADYMFTEERPPSASKMDSFNIGLQALTQLSDNISPKWIWADGAEAIVVSHLNTFESSASELTLSIADLAPVSMADLLCLGRNTDQIHAKLRISHPRGDSDGTFPLAILDGRMAFAVHEHLARTTNLLVLLDRSDYQQGIRDAMLELRSVSLDALLIENQGEVPNTFPAGFEIAAYLAGST